ncbi:MAG: sensor histidine kinase [bacterium]|nr:sensor histidine kinase [bacterium]
MVHASGTAFDAEISAGVVTIDGTRAVQLVGRDISQRLRVEERQALLMRELDHRVKNNLAGVLAIAQQSMGRGESVADFEQAFSGRIHALARTHETLAAVKWKDVALDRILSGVTGPYSGSAPTRVVATGPDVRIRSSSTTPVGIALHELTTNAVKHGALADPAGRVAVDWSLVGASHTRDGGVGDHLPGRAPRHRCRGGRPVSVGCSLDTGRQRTGR